MFLIKNAPGTIPAKFCLFNSSLTPITKGNQYITSHFIYTPEDEIYSPFHVLYIPDKTHYSYTYSRLITPLTGNNKSYLLF